MIDKKNTVILVALEQELPKSYLPGWKIIYTGVGKVNASFAISRSYFDYKPEYVKSILNNNTGKKGLQNVFENVNSLPFKYKDNELSLIHI